MHVCIVGAGKVGYYLAKTLLEHGHDPVVIEQDPQACRRIANGLDIHVISGDGTSVNILKTAGCDQCHSLIAVTGQDEDNLIACQLAKRVFHCKRTVARVNNPRNAHVLKKLGVDIAVSSTDNIVRILEREVETTAIRHLLNLAGGTASLVEIALPDNFRYHGRTLLDIPIPEDFNIVSITRDGELLIPRGQTILRSGDKLVCVTLDAALHTVVREWRLPNI